TATALYKLQSISPIHWHTLQKQWDTSSDSDQYNTLENGNYSLSAKRKSMSENNVGSNQESSLLSSSLSSSDAFLTIDKDMLAKIEGLCRVRICYEYVKSQLLQ